MEFVQIDPIGREGRIQAAIKRALHDLVYVRMEQWLTSPRKHDGFDSQRLSLFHPVDDDVCINLNIRVSDSIYRTERTTMIAVGRCGNFPVQGHDLLGFLPSIRF